MKSNASTGKLAFALPVLILLASVGAFLFNRGYGKVSPDAYEVSKALYGACLAKNEDRLEAVELLLDRQTEKQIVLNAKERRWIESMIDAARSGDWESASKSARRMMEDQVEH
jgi:hypothetical protein